MTDDFWRRLVVIGNSGSGKSTLADRLGSELMLPSYDLDLLHWLADGRKREELEARALVTDVAAGEKWVIEGVYGWLAEVAAVRATALVWLDLPWSECEEGLRRRGLRRGMTSSDHETLLLWAGAYRTRTTSSSFAGHERIFQAFGGRKIRLRSRHDVSSFAPTGPERRA